MKSPRYLVIENPISNAGHLDSWHALFVELLLHDGWKIIAATSDPSGFADKLRAKGLAGHPHLVIDGPIQPPASPLSTLRRLWSRWSVWADARQFETPFAAHGARPSLTARLSHAIEGAVVKVMRAVVGGLHALYVKLRATPASATSGPVATHIDPQTLRHRMDDIIARHPGQILAIFSMYVDAYFPGKAHWDGFRFAQAIPWMGLCITPAPDGTPEGYYLAPDYRGTCFLDETACSRYRASLPGFKYECLPDIAESALPQGQIDLVAELRRRAGNRRIVFMGGTIGKQKNLSRWYQLIALADTSQWFFVQIGRINRNNLTAEDEAALAAALANPPAHLFIKADYLPDERDFNAVIAASDVIFAVYLDFDRSSNMLSKAACFEKPILVADGFLMGERVRRYRIGLAVNPRQVSAIHEGLLALEAIEGIRDNFRNYRDDFSERVMQARLTSFIEACADAGIEQ